MHFNALSPLLYRRLIASWVLLSFLILILFPAHYHLHHNESKAVTPFQAAQAEQHSDHYVDVHLAIEFVDDIDHHLNSHVISTDSDANTQASALKLLQLLAIFTLVVLITLQAKTIPHRWLLCDSGPPRSRPLLTPPLRAPPRG